MEGYLYILSNPLMPNVIKIGFTSRSPEERRRELSRPSGVPEEFKIEYEIFSPNIKVFEKRIHKDLKDYRVNGNKEFFKVDMVFAIEVIRKRNEELTYDITTKTSGVNEIYNKYEAVEILGKLKQLYGDDIRSEIKSIRIYQTALRCYLEVTEENELRMDTELDEEEREYYKIPILDQTTHRTDLLFICDSPKDPMKPDFPFFSPKNAVSMNARLFLEKLDAYSIWMCTDIFRKGLVIERKR